VASRALKKEATCSSETSVDFQRTSRRYIPENRTLHNHAVRTSNSFSPVVSYSSFKIILHYIAFKAVGIAYIYIGNVLFEEIWAL
jgi:hypothetical protein